MNQTISLAIGKKEHRLELLFSKEPPYDLALYLKELGFKNPIEQRGLFYSDRHAAYVQFAEKLKAYLEQGNTHYQGIPIAPSYTPSDANIDHDKFSYVTITYLHNKVKMLDSYVVFEPYLRLAKIIAQQFGKLHFGDAFIEVNVKARQLKGKSRKLLKQGKVITAELLKAHLPSDQDQVIEQPKENTTETNEEASVSIKEQIKEESDNQTVEFIESTLVASEKKPVSETKLQEAVRVYLEELNDVIGTTDQVLDQLILNEFQNEFQKVSQNSNFHNRHSVAQLLKMHQQRYDDIENTAVLEVYKNIVSRLCKNAHIHQKFALKRWKNSTTKAVVTDLLVEGKSIPNVMLPKGLTKPFTSGDFSETTSNELQKKYPYLLEFSEQDLEYLDSLTLFQLMQLGNPNKFGITINQLHLMRVFNEKGKQIFKELGYPVDLDYPYQNLRAKGMVVVPLQRALRSHLGGDKYALVANSFRPLGDLKKGLTMLNTLITKLETSKKTKDRKELQSAKASKTVIEKYLGIVVVSKPSKDSKTKKSQKVPTKRNAIYALFSKEKIEIPFKGTQVFERNIRLFELLERASTIWANYRIVSGGKIEQSIEEIQSKLSEKQIRKNKDVEQQLKEVLQELEGEVTFFKQLVLAEKQLFQKEFMELIKVLITEKGKTLPEKQVAHFIEYLNKELGSDQNQKIYVDQPVEKLIVILIDNYFFSSDAEQEEAFKRDDYLDKVIAIMHNHYIKRERLTRKKIENLLEVSGAGNLGKLWEAVELSWLLWYKKLYQKPTPFASRLQEMIDFWENVQPSYQYSDSSKELYKQYSTPCPIGAMIAEYTRMSDARRIFEPSAGNGLLLVGADPRKVHVNEIDNSRRDSLEYQLFKKITNWDASKPFPKEMENTFDVVVTNPPFDKWNVDPIEKDALVRRYFNNHQLASRHIRLEQLMAGLALKTLKDSGKSAIVILDHVRFNSDGFIKNYRHFFNWLYRHYRVDDMINLNGFRLYNKQGAVTKMLLILISGRRPHPKGSAPLKEEAPHLEEMVDSFFELWQRVTPHIKTPFQLLIEQLKIANDHDIL